MPKMGDKFAAKWDDENLALSPANSHSIEYIVPSEALKQYFTVFYRFESQGEWARDVQPSGIAQLQLSLAGERQMRFETKQIYPHFPVAFVTPSNAAIQYITHGPRICFGCSLTPLGWRAVTGLPASSNTDRILDGEELLGSGMTDLLALFHKIEREQAGEEKNALMAKMLSDYLTGIFKPIPDNHQEIVSITMEWLNASLSPDLDNLYPKLMLGKRQAQRIINEYFGCSPTFLARKYRAIWAAISLNDPDCSRERQSEIEELFFDQPHMIREIRHFTGRTPRSFGDDVPLLRMWLDKKNTRLLPKRQQRDA